MDKIWEWVKHVYLGLIPPALGSLVLGMASYGDQPQVPNDDASAAISFVIWIITLGIVFASNDNDYDWHPYHWIAGSALWLLFGVFNSNVLNWEYSLGWSTVFIFGIATVALAAIGLARLGRTMIAKVIKRRKTKAQAEAEYKKNRLISNVKQLVGDDALARGFMTALDELTKHVPDQATELLEALMSDLEEFQVLESLIGSTKNELLRQRSRERLGAIQSAVQQTCAEVTEEAVEIIRLRQMSEADAVLGNKDEPKLVQARENFNHFLEGLREVRSITSPTVDPLIDEIEPKAEVLKIEPPKKSIK